MNKIRVRFAPSPTGYLHIGGARTCLFNWLYAKRYEGKLILRIEDTDFERLKENSVQQILSSLKWLGLNWDEGPQKGGTYGPYFQSQRLEIYRAEAKRLVEEGKAYYCYCTPQELDEQRKKARVEGKIFKYDGRCKNLNEQQTNKLIQKGINPVIRIKSPLEGQTVIDDKIRGKVFFENSLLDDIIILKSNNMPAYNFACVVDDNGMKISHVIRAEEHLSNTPKQIMLYKALGYKIPKFVHVSMILASDRSKLSKRHGATSVEEYRELGFLPEAVINYLCLLGWSTQNQNEIINLDNASRQFSFERVSKNSAIYDTKKLAWINGQYLKTLNIEYITKLTIPFIEKVGVNIQHIDKEKLKSVLNLVRQKVWTLVELVEASKYFFEDISEYEEKGIKKYFSDNEVKQLLKEINNKIKEIKYFNQKSIEEVYRKYSEEMDIKTAKLIHPTRLALTGKTVSPGLFEVMEIMGKEECTNRIDKAVEFISNNLR